MSKRNNILILTLGVFSIINTEMGIIGLLPLVSSNFEVTITTAGLLVSLFALAVAVAGPTMPLLFSGMDRKKAMLLVLGVFLACNIFSIFATSFTALLVARVLPAFFHPIYCSLAFTVAASSVSPEEAPKAVSKVLMGVSAGMVLGVPIASFIASTTSFTVAMFFFAVVSAVAFVVTLLFIPAMPVKERLSYGAQVSVLGESIVWVSIVAVILLNGAIFGVFSYLAEYLGNIASFSPQVISFVLLLYGLANILGNVIAGRLLSNNARNFVVVLPVVLTMVYGILLLVGQFALPMVVIILFWGILSGAGQNINQYLIATAAPKAPEFANGLFLTSANLGVTFGATVCGLFIANMGTKYVVLGGIIFSILSIVVIVFRARISKDKNKSFIHQVEFLEGGV